MWLLISELKNKWSRQVSLPCQRELKQSRPRRIKQAMIAPGKTKQAGCRDHRESLYEVAYPLPPAEPFIVLLFLGGLGWQLRLDGTE